MSSPKIPRVPRATYRLQLTPDFGFAAAEAELDYFAALGISDLYLSPILTASPGSTHGYDVADYHVINAELGGQTGFDSLCAAAQRHGLGLILDFVPNHMGISSERNHWWQDVLRWGRRSRYADYFDIQWFRQVEGNRPRVLLPILETHVGKMVASGRIQLEETDGRLTLVYDRQRLPVNLEGHAFLLATLDPQLGGQVAQDFAALAARETDADDHGEFVADAAVAESALAGRVAQEPAFAKKWREAVAALNQAPRAEMLFLLRLQHYRLARWKAGIHEINYRRFFAISSLVGVKMENPRVFDDTHAALAEILRQPAVSGLRIDHVDGLQQPAEYLERLQALARKVRGEPIYLVVEKILNGDEALPAEWPVHGTTGYELIPQLAGVCVQGSSELAFQENYAAATGDPLPFAGEVVARKNQIMRELFPDVIGMLGWQLADLIAEDPLWSDFSRHELTSALARLTAHLPVYRLYRTKLSELSPSDAAAIATALAGAAAADPLGDPAPLKFIAHLLGGSYPPSTAPADYAARALAWVMSWQQYTGAIMAKSVEDTAYYTYVRLVGLNEVGGDPASFGQPVAHFHARNLRQLQDQPHSLLTTSTHDSKVSEDVRARLYALSEYPDEWSSWVIAWEAATRRFVTILPPGEAPDARDRYRTYQILLGMWPAGSGEIDAPFRGRFREHLRKAVGEAKRWTSDVRPNTAYLAACDRFIDSITDSRAGRDFLSRFLPAAEEVAMTGARTALAQVIFKTTLPGVPDFYQGCEGWNFNLVDPDNRRPVNFPSLHDLFARAQRAAVGRLWENWRAGEIKCRLTHALLGLRRVWPQLFAEGDYTALTAEGPFPLVSYVRSFGKQSLAVVVPQHHRVTPASSTMWVSTQIKLPAGSGWRDVLTGRVFPAHKPAPVGELFSVLPFALLVPAS